VRVPLDGWNTEERRRLRALAAGAQIDIRWEGDDAVFVGADDEARLRDLVTSIRPAPRSAPSTTSGAPFAGVASVAPEASARASAAAMWAIDPTGRHEYRYWSGDLWTAHVADHGFQSADPVTDVSGLGAPIAPPPGAYPGTPAVTGTAWTGAGSSAAGRRDPTAVMGRRYGAFFIDVFIVWIVFSVLYFALATQRTPAETLRLPGCSRETQSDQITCDDRVVLQVGDNVYEGDFGLTAAISVALIFLYFGLLEGMVGATLGKFATGIRVVKEDGSIQGVPKSLVRWVVFAVDGPLSLFLCGIITSATSSGHRRLGDTSARTYVVAKDAVGHPIDVN
jgi:uncharacterized RDD family membrane protein YckC